MTDFEQVNQFAREGIQFVNDTLLKRSVTDEMMGFNIAMKDEGIYRFILKGQATGIGTWSEDYAREVAIVVQKPQ